MYTAIIETDNDLLRFIIQQNLIPAVPTGIIITLQRCTVKDFIVVVFIWLSIAFANKQL